MSPRMRGNIYLRNSAMAPRPLRPATANNPLKHTHAATPHILHAHHDHGRERGGPVRARPGGQYLLEKVISYQICGDHHEYGRKRVTPHPAAKRGDRPPSVEPRKSA